MKNRFWNGLCRLILGPELPTAAITHEQLTVMMGLAVFGADALSSTAYATEEMFIALKHGGCNPGSFFIAIPLSIIISIMIVMVTISYRQIVMAFPEGGGVYSVAKATLGERSALVGGASLITDYTLTLTVSIAAGVGAMISAFPTLAPYRVNLCVSLIILLGWLSLRGVKENAKVLSVPIYLFIAIFFIMIVYGFFMYATGGLVLKRSLLTNGSMIPSLGLFSLALLIRTFASGCTAATGIEAVSNGAQAMRAPSAENAAKVMTWMAVILSSIFIGVTVLACLTGATPSADQTIVAQIAGTIFGDGIMKIIVLTATTIILTLAANTAFADLPRVLSTLAKDGYFPYGFMNLGSRLVYKNGIMALIIFSTGLIYIFKGDVHAIIPLYAICVFLSFSISQLGMIVMWSRQQQIPIINILINGLGLIATVLVFLSELYSKFSQGAWILIPIVIGLVTFMKFISNYYKTVNQKMALNGTNGQALPKKTIIVWVPRMNRASLHAVNVAKTFSPEHLMAIHVAIDAEEGETIRKQWIKYVPDVPIEVCVSEYRDLITPVLDRLKSLDAEWTDDEITVVIPDIVPEHWWGHLLHNQTASLLRRMIIADPDINAQVLEAPIKIGAKI